MDRTKLETVRVQRHICPGCWSLTTGRTLWATFTREEEVRASVGVEPCGTRHLLQSREKWKSWKSGFRKRQRDVQRAVTQTRQGQWMKGRSPGRTCGEWKLARLASCLGTYDVLPSPKNIEDPSCPLCLTPAALIPTGWKISLSPDGYTMRRNQDRVHGSNNRLGFHQKHQTQFKGQLLSMRWNRNSGPQSHHMSPPPCTSSTW